MYQSQLLSRRQCIKAAALVSVLPSVSGCSLMHRQDNQTTLTLEAHPITLIEGTTTPAWTFNRQYPAPILRFPQNQPVRVKVVNLLDEPTTIHWHGLRINNAADGVPYLTQKPIAPGETFLYEFTCPDAGTFWYHPHMNSLEQLSRGLVGLIIVEEENPVSFAADLPLILKDWHLNPDGSFAPFTSARAAARIGTLGNHATVNGQQSASYPLPAGGWCRIRIANVDNTRVFTVACDHPAMIVAEEGNPLASPRPLTQHPLGAGMRVDLAIQMPKEQGQLVQLLDQKGRFGFPLCSLISDTPKNDQPNTSAFSTMPELPLNPLKPIERARARRIPLVFEWAGALSPGFAGKDQQTLSSFWTINKRAWLGHGPKGKTTDNPGHLPEPLATIEYGEHIIFELHNATPHHHPIHLHGYTFTVLSSSQRTITPYHTDTVLMQKYERMEVAIVADNPGQWMFHCHVIEHMKTGLMGYIKVNEPS